MDVVRVGQAIAKGTSIVCATCQRYWEGRDRGLPEPRCTTQSPCGSPLAGLSFPSYRGPITDFTRWCFVCGESAKFGIKATGSEVVFGMCAKHIDMVGRVQAVGLNGHTVQEVLSAQHRASPDKFFSPPKPSLGQAIVEAEAYFKERDQR